MGTIGEGILTAASAISTGLGKRKEKRDEDEMNDLLVKIADSAKRRRQKQMKEEVTGLDEDEAELISKLPGKSDAKIKLLKAMGVFPENATDALIKRANALKAARELGDEEVGRALLGETEEAAEDEAADFTGNVPSDKQTKDISDRVSKLGLEVPEKDNFTGELTKRGLEQKARNESLIKDRENKQAVLKKNRESLDTYMSDASSAITALEKVSRMAEKLGDFERGFFNQSFLGVQAAVRQKGKDKAITDFKIALSQELIPLARKLGEEKGPITASDIETLEPGLGADITTPLEDKFTAYNELINKVDRALEVKRELAEIPEDEFNKKYGKIVEQISVLRDRMSSVLDPEGKGVFRQEVEDKVDAYLKGKL